MSTTTPGVLSHYGMRQGAMHSGVDFSAPEGAPVYAVLPGVVTHATINGAPGFAKYGHTVVLKHSNPRVWTQYAHLLQLPSVTPGQQVQQGQLLGYVGRTRGSWDKVKRQPVPDWFHESGPHLHFEVRTRGYPANPGVGTLEPLQFLAAHHLPWPVAGAQVQQPEPQWFPQASVIPPSRTAAGGSGGAVLAVLAVGVIAATALQSRG